MKAIPKDLTRFLWGYFRSYTPIFLLTFVVTLIFAGSTVFLLALFRPILSDVLMADRESASGTTASIFMASEDEAVEDEAAADGAEGEAEDPGLAARLGLDIDLDAFFERLIEAIKSTVGVSDDNVVWMLPVLFVIIFLIRSLADFFNGYLFQIIGLGATNDLRNDLYNRILHQSSRFYQEHPSGELVSRVGNDISVMQNAISNRMLDLLTQSVVLVFLVWYLLSTHFRLALMCLIVVPAVIYPIVRFGSGMRRTSRSSQERLADLSNLVAEAVRGHRVVKAFGMEGFELARFREATARHLRVRLKAQLLAHGAGPVVESMAAVGAAAFLVWAGFAVRRGELTASQLVQFLTNLIMLYDPVRKLNKVNLVLQESLAAAQRVADVMRVPNEVVDDPQARVIEQVQQGVSFEGVSFAYEEAEVLRGIDLHIRCGELVALVGPSGAGKSTLVNLLPRFFDPDAGRVTLDGIDLRQIRLASLRSHIGVVTQDTVLFNDTVRNNIAYGRDDLPFEQVLAAAQAAYAEEFIEELPAGWDTVIGESGLKLSGGQRQRLAIARALVKNPPILILDEATSHLDSESEALVQKALHNLMQGRTALVIAHRLSTIQRADRILVMEQGRIVEEGNHQQLLARGGAYRHLHDLQFQDPTA